METPSGTWNRAELTDSDPGAGAVPLSQRRVDVLLVEDEPAHAELAAHAFERVVERFRLTVVPNLSAARSHVAEAGTHLVVADLMLPDGRGTELLTDAGGAYPVVLLTSQGDEQIAVGTIKSGAIDYVVKTPTTLADLPRIAERALREWRRAAGRAEERNRYETILAATSDIIAQIDTNGSCCWCNQAGTAFFGEAAASMIEQQLDEAVVAQFLSGERHELYVEGWAKRADGDKRLLAWWHRALEDKASSRTVGMLCTARDITEARRLERELQHAQKIEALGHLSASIAHDFNNLLMAITSSAEVALGMLDVGSAAGEEIRLLKREALAGASLTRQLLAFARKQDVDMSVVDLCTVVAEIEPMMRRLVGPSVRVRVDRTIEDGHVLGDRGQLEQSLLNLVVNARDAMPDGGEVVIEIQECRDGILLTVSDEGCGMDEETRSRAFEPYFTTKATGAGTGLGLSTVYGIIGRHGGDVQLRSEKGQGASFRICLPRVAGGVVTPDPPAARESFPPRPATVLVVEDQPASRRALKSLLEASGYQVLVAATCEQALQRCVEHVGPLDIVLADLRLPDAQGTELVDQVRPLMEPSGVIFMSGVAPDDPAMADRLEAPDTAFVSKPIEFDELERQIRQLLGRAARSSSRASRD
jgi:PAS domain S-box-containing protein